MTRSGCCGYLKWMCTFYVVVGCIHDVSATSRPPTMTLNNNEYTNMVIAIHDSIPEDLSLIDKIKDTFTQASKQLYTATRRRAYFKEITILLPSSWSDQASYGAHTSEKLSIADVIITDPIRGKRSLPQTRSYEGCGKQGVHVLLTKEFLTAPATRPYDGEPAKYLIHAFAQFRWGVFQEYAEEGESEFYISFQSAYPEAIRCVYGLKGLIQRNNTNPVTPCYPMGANPATDPATGLYQADCVWRPYPTRQRVKASIMDHQYITVLETFCDDNTTNYMTEHNFEAPSKHNRLCGHRSTWDIITSSDDFKGGRNPPGSLLDSQLDPTFKVVKATARKKRALVLLDASMSKSAKNEAQHSIDRLRQEAKMHSIDMDVNLIQSVDDIRKFSSVDDEQQIVLMTENHTAQLQDHHHTTTTPIHVLLSGQNILTDGHKTHTLTTGSSIGHRHADRLRHIVLGDHMDTDYVLVAQREHLLHGDTAVTGSVGIDALLAPHLTFAFHYEGAMPYIDVISPSAVIYDSESPECTIDTQLNMATFHFDFTEVGVWKYKISQSYRATQLVQLTVSSKSEPEHIDPIAVRPSLKVVENGQCLLMHVDVTQGTHPVVGLDVTANIETPNGQTEMVPLLDNGSGIDVSKSDGVYSRSFCQLSTSGMHHVTYVITGSDDHVYTKEQTFSVHPDKADIEPIRKHQTKRSIGGIIERHVYGGSKHLESHVTVGDRKQLIGDTIMPSRVSNLRAEISLDYRNTLVLTWTAPGDDLDNGKASSYELFVGYDIDDVRAFLTFTNTGYYIGQGHVYKEMTDVKAAGGETEVLLWKPKYTSRTLAFSIRATDDAGNTGATSNVASARPPMKILKGIVNL